ncbi:MAG: DNA cytosine methyltransferase [Phycisphaerales bacterium]
MAPKSRKKVSKKPTAFDCFAGCGGMSEGFRLAGYRVIGAVEIDKDAADVYKLNHRDVTVWTEDITGVSAKSILKKLRLKKGDLDLLGGCPPCQGFSTLRTLNGNRRIRDEQNDLIFEFQRLVLGLKPKRVMMENVPGLFANRRLRKFKAALANAGYTVEAKVLDVGDFGVPQRRRRMVLLASRVSSVAFAKKQKTGRTVRQAIGGMPKAGASGDKLHDLPENRSLTVAARIREVPANGGSRASLPSHLKLKCHKTSDGFKDVYGRMAWNEPSPTITTGCFNPSKGRFLHPEEHRAITMREAALLQSFRKCYKFPASLGKVKVATMIGNALPPRFIRAHARMLKGGTN